MAGLFGFCLPEMWRLGRAQALGELPAHFFNHLAQLFPAWKRSTTGQENVGQQLIARQAGQVQALGKGLDPVGMAAE